MRKNFANSRLIQEALHKLEAYLEQSHISFRNQDHIFVFICGANNKEGNDISPRRKSVIEFAKHNLPNTEFLLAEKVFEALQAENKKENILEVEHTISEFSDYILIILESNSTFTELGAFSKKELLEKLIVINNSAYANSKSFINLGPINLIKSNSPDQLILYPMAPGVEDPDAIGSTFFQLKKILSTRKSTRGHTLTKGDLADFEKINKKKVMFIHDLIYLAGHINRPDIITLLKRLFNEKQDYKIISRYLALLCSFNFITQVKGNDSASTYYYSNRDTPYLIYKRDINNIISIFRLYNLKERPEAIYGT